MALEKTVAADKIELRDIRSYEGLYAIASNGQVWSYPKGTNSKNGNWMTLDMSRNYPMVALTKNGKQTRYAVHRLVAQEFCDKPEGCDQVNHINGIKTDNNASNLEWVTGSENRKHAWLTGLQKTSEAHKQSARNAGYGRRLFSMEQAEKIRQIYASGSLNQYQLADQYNTSQAVINGIVSNKTYTKEAA